MKTPNKVYTTASELAEMLGVSTGTAYRLIRNLNKELSAQGFITISGKVSSQLVRERWYGLNELNGTKERMVR